MDTRTFKKFARSLPGAVEERKWGAPVFTVGGKMFAIIWNPSDPLFAFKTSDTSYELLIEHGLAEPAAYFWRAKWVQMPDENAMPNADLKAYIAQAHAIVSAKLTRAMRQDLGLLKPGEKVIRRTKDPLAAKPARKKPARHEEPMAPLLADFLMIRD
jgi:predicted DNA-binding protein (MmcQ/YjbR family)